MSDEKVIHLNPHERMTPVEALSAASLREWDEVVILGYQKDSNELSTMSSAMSRRDALWIAEFFRLHVIGLDRD